MPRAPRASHRPGEGRCLRAPRVVLALAVGVTLGCGSSWSPPEATGHRRTDPVAAAGERVGAAACTACHASFPGHYTSSDYHADCETCHGAAQLHAHTAKAKDIAQPGNIQCEACHGTGAKTLLGWSSSRHARADLLCSDCHNPHNRELFHVRAVAPLETAMLRSAGSTTRLCGSCHPEVVAQLNLPSHHPIGEGMLDCTDCHSPHGDRATALGPDTQMCTTCHQEVAGPWIFEHAPVSEDCGYCHAAHGASGDFLLEVPQPAGCISCHTIPISGAVHDPWAFTTRCTDCHNAIHGSHTDPSLRR